MRILGFTKKWDKLKQAEFTTFRFPRKDKDWEVGEQVQIVYKPRSKEREMLGIAKIINKEARCMAWDGSKLTEPKITNEEAIADGFADGETKYIKSQLGYFFMWEFLWDYYSGVRLLNEPMNKLTLKWDYSFLGRSEDTFYRECIKVENEVPNNIR